MSSNPGSSPTPTMTSTRATRLKSGRAARKSYVQDDDDEELDQFLEPKKGLKADLLTASLQLAADQAEEDEDDYASRGRKTKKMKLSHAKTTKKRKRSLSPPPPPPEMSEDEFEKENYEEDFELFEKPKKLAPPVKASLIGKVLKLEVRKGPATINIDLADTLRFLSRPGTSQFSDLEDTTLVGSPDGAKTVESNTLALPQSASNSALSTRLNPEYACFLELEPELRNRIYRHLLVQDNVIKLDGHSAMPDNAQLLRASKQIAQEGAGILYGENVFHFSRMHKQRGSYLSRQWKEVGYKDVRRFLEAIGPANIARMQYLSVEFEDGAAADCPNQDPVQRRFVNDAVVLYILDLISNSGVIFEKFAYGFVSKSDVTLREQHFLRAFLKIRAYKIVETCAFGHSRNTVNWAGSKKKMRDEMQVERDYVVDEAKCKTVPRMQHERLSQIADNCHCQYSRSGGCSRRYYW